MTGQSLAASFFVSFGGGFFFGWLVFLFILVLCSFKKVEKKTEVWREASSPSAGSSKLQHKELRTCCIGSVGECREQRVQTVRPCRQRNKTSSESARTETFAISHQVTVWLKSRTHYEVQGQYEVKRLEILHVSFLLLGIFSNN